MFVKYLPHERCVEIKTMEVPFLFLSLDLPPPPLFQDEMDRNIIPQVSIIELLSKYDGVTSQVKFLNLISVSGRDNLLKHLWKKESDNILKRYKIVKLPLYLVLIVRRFVKNNFVSEKNPTIVNFPIKALDMADCEYFKV